MALSRHHSALSRPLSIPEIVSQAQDFEFRTDRSLQQWIRAGKMLLTEAAICEQDGNLQMAYLYLYRHAELVLDRLPQHPDYRNPRFTPDLAEARKALERNIQKLEQWKPRIAQEYQRYVKAMERRNAERQRVQQERERDEGRSAAYDSRRQSLASEDGQYDGGSQIEANQNQQLAVEMAHREIRRRDRTRQTTRQAGISPGTVANRRRGVVLGSADQDDMLDGSGQNDGVREAGRYLYEPSRKPSGDSQQSNRALAARGFHYPAVPAKEDSIDWGTPALQPAPARSSIGPPPSLPAKDSAYSAAPARPPKFHARETLRPPSASPSPPPASQSKYTFKPTASTEAGVPLRTVLLPPDLRTSFLNLAHNNTLRNLETCGILCGTLISNALFISHLIIPDQQSTSDTCDTTEEGDNALFDYCDGADLLVCGWIHTHPTQTCFLSSRDLHTSSGYQVMLPEAIAIVCAPRHTPDWGIFRLTDPPGLNAVLNCHRQGLFHPHDETNIYTDALRPGHVVEAPGLKFEVVDLRKR